MSSPAQLALAYFSHSYRSSEKHLNLTFWEMLSKHGLYFTVDPKKSDQKSDREPMDVTYLEWMMRRSACFVAVIPYRDDPPHCSPYQLFEYSIAIRARKPRLIFYEDGIPEHRIEFRRGEAVLFRRFLTKNIPHGHYLPPAGGSAKRAAPTQWRKTGWRGELRGQ
jgi:hypothetical protein